MKNLSIIFVIVFVLSVRFMSAQTNTALYISISPTYGANVVNLADSSFFTNDTNNLQIDLFKFYVSHFQFLKEGIIILEEQNSFHLVDASDPKSLQITIPNKQNIVFDQLNFNLGIDSVTAVSGAMGGDLDPTKGMYWSWQSGYINCKLEGKSNLCSTRNNEFQFHLGGYQSPFNTLQALEFPIFKTEYIHITIDIKKIFENINLATVNHVMSPNSDALQLSKTVSKAISIK